LIDIRSPVPRDILVAQERIRRYARSTPLVPSPGLSKATDSEVRLKLDTLQPTGSFKLRGAFNAILALAQHAPDARIVTASSGNHGVAIAAAAAATGLDATILVGRTTPEAKLQVLTRYQTPNVQVEVLEVGSDEAETVARSRAELEGLIYVPPYNDPLVIAGQGTAAVEILFEWPQCDCIVAPVGGGGLISGLGLWAKSVDPSLRLIGVQSEASPTMALLLEHGSIEPIAIAETLADGAAGNIEPGSITIGLCYSLLDDLLVIDEDSIVEAIRWSFTEHQIVLEGSAALGVAALLDLEKLDVSGSRVAVLITGQLIDREVFASILSNKGR
jgi:threonine dehydratase